MSSEPSPPPDAPMETSERAEGGMRFAAWREDDVRRSFEMEDRRWEARKQARDWLVLALMIILTIAWTLVPFLFEPGLRDFGAG